MRKFRFFIPQFLICVLACITVNAQSITDTLAPFKAIVPGPEYHAHGLKRWLWGNNYRDIWTMPTSVKVLNLDSVQSHYTIIEPGIINETLNLHVQDASGKTWLIRPVDKTLGKNLPQPFRKTFIEQRLNDGGSASHPFGGAPVPLLANAAGVYSANINYRYLPSQPALGNYDSTFGNNFYVFEELAPGNFKNYITTAALLDTLNINTGISINRQAFIRARLFDMFLNDWNRHEQNWLWGATTSGGKTVYIPLPINRDQALSDYDGVLFGAGLGAGRLNYFQKFRNDIPNVDFINQREKDIDRRLLNEASLEEWISTAKELQQALTDEVIDEAVKQLPPEVYEKTGAAIAATLKERRRHIAEWANTYYHFITEEVEITGSANNDRFDVQRLNNNEVLLKVYNGSSAAPFYARSFKASETKEIRLFGLKGNDVYHVYGEPKSDIKIKISDGINNDSVADLSSGHNNKIVVYANNNVATNGAKNIRINTDTTLHSYRYDWFHYNRRGITPIIFFSMEDRLYAGLTYRIVRNKWDKRPFASAQSLSLHYSLLELAPSLTYKALFPKLVAHANLSLLANYDHIRWQFYYGLGNDSYRDTDKKIKYYTTRTRQWIFQPQLTRIFGKSTVTVSGDVQGIKIINDSTEFIGKPGENTTDFKWQHYAGGGLMYSYKQLDDPIVPVKGFYVDAAAYGEQNLNNSASHYIKYSGNAYFYIPLVSKFSFNIRAGASTIAGNPEFYQLPSLGGVLFRGTSFGRFRGKTAFYNTNDIRFISPFHSWLFNGKAGFLAFCDNGRVWLPGEHSNTWHVAYGAGLIAAPFNFIYADGTVGFYKNEWSVQVRVTWPIL